MNDHFARTEDFDVWATEVADGRGAGQACAVEERAGVCERVDGDAEMPDLFCGRWGCGSFRREKGGTVVMIRDGMLTRSPAMMQRASRSIASLRLKILSSMRASNTSSSLGLRKKEKDC